MRKLVFDIALTGHHSEYINHLVDYLLNDSNTLDEYFFVIHYDFALKFPDIYNKVNNSKKLKWIEITKKELEFVNKGNLLKRSFNYFNLMNAYAKKYNVVEAYLLYFNIFQLALIFKRVDYNLKGILFLQFYRMSQNNWKERLKYYRKYLITKLYVLNPNLRSIYVLNDDKTVNYLNKEFKTEIFKMLPDPIPNLDPIQNFNIYEHYNIGSHKKIFLHIGSLGSRKGTIEIIEALRYIPKAILNEITILFIGKAENKDFENLMIDKIKDTGSLGDNLMFWDNQFVSSAMMKSVFNQCFAVLMPYKNVEASSGILGHAVAANKKVITTGQGLLKEIVEENNLGVLINEVKPEEIAIEMFNLLEQKGKTNFESISYLKMHTPKLFSEKILIN